MNTKFIGIMILVVAACVESVAQLSLKIGAAGGSHILSSPYKGWAGRFRLSAAYPWILIGILLYGIQIVLWTLVLHLLEVSIAFPMDSLCFVGVALLSTFILGESVGRERWLGVFCILCGTVLLAM